MDLIRANKKYLFCLFLLSNYAYNVYMTKQLITQSVPTLTLSISFIRETLNPTPGEDAPAGIWREHGYLDAMLDAALADYADDEDEPTEILNAMSATLEYVGCEWHTLEWDQEGVDALEEVLLFKGLDQEEEYRYLPPWGD